MVILLVPFLVVGGVLYFQISSTLLNNTRSLINQRLHQEKEKTEIRVSGIERLGLQATNHTVLKDFFDKDTFTAVDFITYVTQYLNPLSEWVASNSDLVSRITYITNNSQIRDTTNIVQYKNVQGQEWIREIETGTKSYECFWEGLHEQRSYLPFTKARYKYMVHSAYFRMPVRGKNATYLELDIQADKLLDLAESSPVGKSGYILAVDNDSGRVIGGRNQKLEEALLQSSWYTSAGGKAEEYSEFSYDKTTYFTGLIKIDKLSVNLMVIVPENEIMEPLRQTRITFITWLIIGFLAIILMAALSSLYAAYKVRRITEAVHRIQVGEYDINLPDRGRDELDELARNMNVMAKRIDDLINRVYKADLAHKESMLAALQAQINPHFMFNTLETFRMMLELKGETEISDAMQVFGSVIRYNTYSIKEMVTLRKELENVRNYISVQNMLHNNRLQVTCRIEEEVLQGLIPSLTLQPVVENSIVHGFRNRTSDLLQIGISTCMEDENIVIRIEDNGCGIPEEQLNRIAGVLESGNRDSGIGVTKSIGLTNINERIRLKFGNMYGIQVFNRIDSCGTVVEIRIPMYTGEE